MESGNRHPRPDDDWKARAVILTRNTADGEVPEEVRGALICPACFQCFGELEVRRETRRLRRYPQRCSCSRKEEPPEKRWPCFDFNTYLELCHCCGIVALASGSRWSPFFCGECKQRVLAFDRSCGRWVIPIGRHTLMHGKALDAASVLADAERFLAGMRGLFGAMDVLWERSRLCVAENLAALGFEPGQAVVLAEYLERAAGRIDKAERFEALVRHFAA